MQYPWYDSSKVQAAIGGASGQADVTVTAANYAISFDSPLSGAQTSNVTLTAQVMNSQGTPVAAAGVSVSWSYANVHGGTATTPAATPTGADGKAIQSIPYISGERRTVKVTASVGGQSKSVDVQLGADLPSGFIALSANRMIWSNAGSYCAAQGGKLPLIDGSTAPVASVPANTLIDGFGHRGIAWPAELPGGDTNSYWTGTPSANDPTNFSWHVYETSSSVNVTTSSKTVLGRRAVCVP